MKTNISFAACILCLASMVFAEITRMFGQKTVWLAVFFSLACVQAGRGAPPKNGYFLLYQDEFNGNALNEDDWYYRASDVARFGGYSQKENVSVITRDGIGFLNLAYTRKDMTGDGVADPVSGGIISKRAFGYGYYEARIKFYDEQVGLHQSFWTVGVGYYSSYNQDYGYNEDALSDRVPYVNSVVEIDVVELDSAYNKGGANFHWHTPSFSTPSGVHKGFDSSYIDTSKWITFGMEWTPGQVVIWVDGVERHRINYVDERYGAQQVWLTALANNNWGGNGYPGPDAAMKVDYFRFYSRPNGGNLAANPGFEHNQAATSVVRNWISDDGIYNNISSDQASIPWNDGKAHTGKGYLLHTGANGAPMMSSRMELEFIPDGLYQASAWVQRSQNVGTAKMRVTGHGGSDRELDIPEAEVWTEVVIDDIEVTNHRLDLSFASQGGDNTWIRVDDVRVIHKDFVTNPILEGAVIDNGDDGYTESGTWLASGLKGYAGSSTRYSRTAGDYAQWNPVLAQAGSYHVYIYKVVYPGNEPNAQIRVSHAGGEHITTLDYTQGSSGWAHLGTFVFDSGSTGYVRNTAMTLNTNSRADAVWFRPVVSDGAPIRVVQSGFNGRNFMMRAANLNPAQSYVLKASSDLVSGFQDVVDGPRMPTPDGDPTEDVFTAWPDPGTDAVAPARFFRLEPAN